MILLTLKSGSKIRINPMLIESYGTITEKTYSDCKALEGLTFIVPAGAKDDNQDYVVTETPEYIDGLISAWLRLYKR